MLIGISGTVGAGKTEVARYLVFQGFKLLTLEKKEIENDQNHQKRENKNGDIYGESDGERDGGKVESWPYGALDVHQNFTDFESLINYVTLDWQKHYVLCNINDIQVLNALQKRPFFLHVSIDAPLNLRFERFQLKKGPKYAGDLAQFVAKNDNELFRPHNPLVEINNQAQIKIINTSSSVHEFYAKLSELNLLNFARLRPTWDSYFMRLADLAALRSNCMKRRVGCVIVRQKRVIATGYNGTPRHLTNCNEGGCPRCNKGEGSGAGLSTCLCLHAEENALLEAGRDRIGGESVLYCNTCPCLTCSIKIVQSGIKEVVYAHSYSMDALSHQVMSEGNIILRQYQPPSEGMFI